MNTTFLKLLFKWNDGIERGAKARLAKALGITQSIVGSWIVGRQKPGELNIRKMSQIFCLPENDLKAMFGITEDVIVSTGNVYQKKIWRTPAVSPEDYADMGAVHLTPSNTIKLPILADVPAGLPEWSDRDVEMFVDIPRFMFPGADFVVKCIGDSLDPEIKKGDFCVIRKMTEALDGKPMLVKTDTGFSMKVIRKAKDGKTWLCSLNPQYKPFVSQECTIIGLVMGRWNRTDKHTYHIAIPEE